MSARAREKDRLTRPIHVRRADVRITFRNEDDFLVEIPARVMLNDLRPAGFVVFATTALNPNSEVTLEVEQPKHFRLSARVAYSQYQPSSSHVLSAQVFPYLIGVILIWKDQALEEAFTKYCAELEDLYVNKKALFLQEVFASAPGETPAAPEVAAAAQAKDPNEVPAPTESDEAGPPSDEKVAAEMAAAAAADVAAKAMDAANAAPAPAAGAPETSAADVLNALKDIDPGTPAAAATTPAPAATETPPAEDEKKAA